MSAVIQPYSTLPPASSSRDDYLTHSRGLRSWIFTLDHKRIGVMYMVAILFFFFIGGVFAILLRTELLTPGPTFTSLPANTDEARAQARDFYNNMFTLHGTVMVFLFLIPSIPAILGNFVLPLMLGAKNVVFPRLNRISFYLYCLGALLLLYVIFSGVIHSALGVTLPGGIGLDTGWTFDTPYSTNKATGSVIAAVLGIFILGLNSILTSINFVASIHMLRPRGMTWFRMPLFLWALYGTSMIQILATPTLAITLFLIIAERVFHVGIFDPNLGGDPVLFQHFFWFYAHPAVYVMILPAMGIISELVSTFSRKHIFGYNFIAYASIAIALLGFLDWGQHMFVSGQSGLVNAIFSLLSFSIAIPSISLICNWLHTLYRGSIRLQTPMLYALGFICIFTIGVLAGLFLGTLATAVHLSKTSFEIAHFHYVLAGSTFFAFLGGMYYWWPKITGKMYSQKWGAIAALLVFVGFNLTFFPLFIAGTRGMPREYATYDPQYQVFNVISTIGAYLLAVGLVIVLLTWLHSLARGRKAPANPWGANSLEWHAASPPPYDNFSLPPTALDPYDLTAWKPSSAEEGWVRQELTDRKQPVAST